MGIGVIGNGTGLHDVLIDTNETNGVTTWYIGNVFSDTTHHEYGSLDGLLVKVVLLSGLVVRSEDSNLLSGSNGTRENSTESEESSSIGGGHHLGYVHHKGTLGVTSSHGGSNGIILRSFVEISSSVLLGHLGTREMENHHL